MSYQVIARKWRPQVFQDLIGQPHISQTLLNALRNDRIPHAFLFTGPRGTGKTSTARILAKSLRCEKSVDFIPCGQCASCLEITEGRSVDVMEIDGASNNGVDSIRELRESITFMPSRGKYKIYIIDEVHMLSTSAFNALLKTLEEPPAHVVFMLATTEVHKIPQTILSRCQRFDFRRISTKAIAHHLKTICDHDGISTSEEALWLVAREGDGSMRDSQSLLDHVISFSDGTLTVESVVRILALTDRVILQDILLAMAERNSQNMLSIIERMNQTGFEPEILMEELLEMIRNALMVMLSPDRLGKQLDVPDNEMQFLAKIAELTSEADLHLLFDMAIKAQQDVVRASDPRLVLEMVLLRMVSAPSMKSIRSLVMSDPPAKAGGNSTAQTKMEPTEKPKAMMYQGPATNTGSTASSSSLAAPVVKPSPEPKTTSSVLKTEVAAAKTTVKSEHQLDMWLELVDRLRAEDALFAAKIENIRFIKQEKMKIYLQVPPHLQFIQQQLNDPEIRKKMQHFIDLTFGPEYSFEMVQSKDGLKGDSVQTVAQKQKSAIKDEVKLKIEQHPQVQAVQKIFNAKIGSINTASENSPAKK